MRLVLTLLLMIVIPVKAMAALALPLVGKPQHGAQSPMSPMPAAAHERSAIHDDHGTLPCHSFETGMTHCISGSMPEAAHECPHLAMPALAAAPAFGVAPDDPLAPAQTVIRALVSVDLGVPQPPPTRLH